MTGPVHVDQEASVTVLRMDDGKVNVLSQAMLGALETGLASAVATGKPIVITGNDRAFSAGLDLKVVPTLDRAGLRAMIGTLHRIVGDVLRAPVPVVAAVRGPAIAGGAVLALACNWRIGHHDAVIGATENAVGVPFPPAFVPLLQLRLSPSTLSRTVVRPMRVRGPEALEMGWWDALADDPLAEARAVASTMAGPYPAAFASLKANLNRGVLEGFPTGGSMAQERFERYLDLFFAPGAMERIRVGIERTLGPRST